MSVARKITVSTRLIDALIDIIVLYVSFSLSLNLLRLLNITQNNSYDILTTHSFISESNYPVLVGIIGLTIALFLLFKKLKSLNNTLFRVAIVGVLLFSYLIGVIAPNIAQYEGNIDSFHHGEQLAPALALEQGKVPYKDLFFLHGAGEDVITPWISQKLFGPTIGSYYFLMGVLQILGTAVFAFLVHRLFKNNLAFLVVLIWFFLSAFAGFYYMRDIPVWVSIVIVLSLFMTTKHRPQKVFALGLVASLEVFYALDRGIFLFGLLAIVLAVQLLFSEEKSIYKLQLGTIRSRLKKVIPGILGYITGQLLAILAFGLSGYLAFIKMSLDITKYQGIIFNTPYAEISIETMLSWLPIIITIVTALIIGRSVIAERKALSALLVFEVVLLLFGVLFFRAATGRPDIGHVVYGSIVIFLTFFFVLVRRLELVFVTRISKETQSAILISCIPLLVVLPIIFSPVVVSYYKLPQLNQAPLATTKLFLTAPLKPDTFWTNDRIEHVTDFARQHAGNEGKLFVFSSEPLFYYTTKLQNPTRYSISWFADPKPLEQEMLSSLKSNPPAVVIYESGTGFHDSPDYASMKDRLPSVNNWILDNYPVSHTIDGTIILTKD